MEIIGKLSEVLPEQSGQGKNGVWTKLSFIIETQDQYPKKVCIDAWGDKVDAIKSLKLNDVAKIDFDVESREYNGKWYTNLKAWRIEKQGAGSSNSSAGFAAPSSSQNPPLPDFEEPSAGSNSFEPTDDLPF
jgi:hypothetical protein